MDGLFVDVSNDQKYLCDFFCLISKRSQAFDMSSNQSKWPNELLEHIWCSCFSTTPSCFLISPSLVKFWINICIGIDPPPPGGLQIGHDKRMNIKN